MEVITSPSNHVIKEIAALRKKENRIDNRLFIIEGEKMIKEAKKSDITITTILFDQDSKKKEEYLQLACQYEKDGIRAIAANERVLKTVCDTVTPQGIAAVCRITSHQMNEIGSREVCIVLDRIQDPGNLGTIIRCAEAMGIEWVIAAGCCDVYNEKTIRATMGSVFRQKVMICDEASSVLLALKEKGYYIYGGALQDNSIVVEQVKFTLPCAMVIGNEGSGISHECLKLCDSIFMIPMQGCVESLNAAVSASIVMWEIAKKRRA